MADWNTGPTLVESAVDTWGTQNTWKQGENTYNGAGANDAVNRNSGGADAVTLDPGAASFHSGAQVDNGENGPGDDKCFSCGESGHRRAECFKAEAMECRFCHQVGHMVKDCPDKPPMICENCGQDGHMRKNCENARKINRENVKDVGPEEAWDKLQAAVKEKDVDDVKEALQEYVKATGGTVTYKELQESFIGGGINLWLIANERSLVDVFTNMDLQGNMGKRYTVSYRFSETPERPRERDGWPQNREELLCRLDNAGDVVDIGIVKCGNCKELGHPAKYCTQEKVERMDVRKTTCFNCGVEGHRVRDCPEPRVDKFACKNCGKSGHKIADCEEPPNLDNVECRKCNETGHFAKDCPQGGSSGGCRNCGQEGHMARDCDQPPNLDNVVCRNCEKTGHFRRDCPEPTDWSKVQCTNCQEYGHTKVRCKKAPTEEPGDNTFSNNFAASVHEERPTGGQDPGGWGAGGSATVEANASFAVAGGW